MKRVLWLVCSLCMLPIATEDRTAQNDQQPMYRLNIGISAEQRYSVAQKLNTLLADEYILFTKLFKYHWNVTGMSFGPLHDLFQDQYEKLFALIDQIAERVRSVGQVPIGTLSEFQEYARLQEQPGRNPDARSMISDLLHDYESIIRNVRAEMAAVDAVDPVTSNFMQEIVQKHEKAAWMLRSHLM